MLLSIGPSAIGQACEGEVMVNRGLKRRDVLMFSASAICLGGPAFATSAATAIDLVDPAKRLRAYMLMRGALDDRLVIGCLIGRYYGVVDDEIVPFFGLVSATFARYRPTADGGFEGATYEVPFFTDIETGEALDRLANPYTGETVSVSQAAFPPARIAIARDLSFAMPATPPRLAYQHHVLPALQSGGDVWMVEETISAIAIPNKPKPMRYAEIVTLHARSSDLQMPGARRVPCETNYESVSSWRPWLKMSDHPGHLNGTGAGRYGVPMEELPANWLEAAAVLRPDVLKDPGAPLDALLKG
jgi:hypothetical protein